MRIVDSRLSANIINAHMGLLANLMMYFAKFSRHRISKSIGNKERNNLIIENKENEMFRI
jgi:hypothetical protein